MSATGDTELEAISNLKDIMIQKPRLLGSIPETKLGKGPKRRLAMLRMIMKKAG